MDTLQTICSRKSVRSYTGEPVSEADLEEILKAGEAAPVGMRRFADFHITVIKNKDLLNEIRKTAATMFGNPSSDPLYGAPTLILVSGKAPEPAAANAIYSSAACIIENMALAATDLGVGNCLIWGAVAALAQNTALTDKLCLPEGFVPFSGLIVGKMDGSYSVRDINMNRIATDTID